ncbi:hypothetical protein F2Q69_00029600 [Brassica cretica]|uniref:Uncharacterized protein n=1 Tax=Brassica cretica TaxID=69181 RepID=A0A8S9RS89_BRACR|nr:hypothetical protein F2Q69_00029600 [Brassica cretica]
MSMVGAAWVLRDVNGLVLCHSRRTFVGCHLKDEAKLITILCFQGMEVMTALSGCQGWLVNTVHKDANRGASSIAQSLINMSFFSRINVLEGALMDVAEHPNDEEEVEGIDLHQQRYPWEGSDMDYLYDEVSISLDGLRSIFESRRLVFLCFNGVEEDDVQYKPLFWILRVKSYTETSRPRTSRPKWKLSDFVLAKYSPMRETSYFSTKILGTFGYAAPEYESTAAAVYKVYSIAARMLADFQENSRGGDRKFAGGITRSRYRAMERPPEGWVMCNVAYE